MSETKHIRTWNFYYQLNSLTSYSILIAILVIGIMIGTLLFGTETNLFDYAFTPHITFGSVILFLKLSLIVLLRFSFIYFLFDFFILCIHIVSGIFQFVSSDMNESRPTRMKPNTKSALKILWEKHRIAFLVSWICIITVGCLILAYLLLSLSDVFSGLHIAL